MLYLRFKDKGNLDLFPLSVVQSIALYINQQFPKSRVAIIKYLYKQKPIHGRVTHKATL